MFKYTFTELDESISVFQDAGQQSTEMQDGFLIVEILQRDGSPVPRATVILYTVQDGKPVTMRVVQTGIDGRTERMPLAAPAMKFSLLETSIDVPSITFSMRIELEGYYTQTFRDTKVFAGTETMHTITLSPLPLGVSNVEIPGGTEIPTSGPA